MPKKRILQVSASHLDIGGVEYQITALSQELSKTFEIYLAADVSDEFHEKFIKTGGTPIKWKVSSRFDPGAILQFNKIIKSVKPDIVHIHDPRAGLLIKPLLRLRGIPVVYTTHLPPYFYLSQGRFSWFRQIIYSKVEQALNHFFTTATIYVSEYAYAHALENHFAPAKKTHLILNGINLEPFRSLSQVNANRLKEQANVTLETPVIGSVARLTNEKNFPFLLKAVSDLHKHGYIFIVWIIGAGPEQNSLSQLTRELGIEAIVKFWEFQKDIPRFLSACDIFVLSSFYEGGRTIAVMEAQAAGKPCLVSRAGDHPSLVENGITGFVIEQGDLNDLVSKIQLLLDSPDLRKKFGKAACEKAFLEYDIHIAVSKHEILYNSLLNNIRDL